jgi:putative inorganic carbon (HCO3(-)) transporter
VNPESLRSLRWLQWLLLALAILSGVGVALGLFWLPLLPLGLALLVFALYRPGAYLLVVASLVPLSVGVNDIGANLGLSLPTEPLIILACLILGVKLFTGIKADRQLLLHPLSILMLLYIIWMFVTAATSTMPLVSFKNALARTWFIIPFFFVFAHLFRSVRNIHVFLTGFVICTLILVLYTLSRHAAEGFVRSHSYSIMWPFFPDHGMYAACIAFAVPPLAMYAFQGGWFGIKLHWRALILAVLLILLFGIVVSYTRATWLSLVAALAMWMLFWVRLPFWSLLLALTLVTGYGISRQDQILYELEQNKQGSDDEIEGHVKSVSNISTDPSNLERINRWKSALRMAAARPITGFGPGTFVFQYAPFQVSSELTIISTHSGDLGDAHSEYFSHLSETGIPGLLIYIAILLYVSAVAFRLVYLKHQPQVRSLALASYLALITYMVHAFLNNYSGLDKIAVPFWGLCAVLTALDVYHRKAESAAEENV